MFSQRFAFVILSLLALGRVQALPLGEGLLDNSPVNGISKGSPNSLINLSALSPTVGGGDHGSGSLINLKALSPTVGGGDHGSDSLINLKLLSPSTNGAGDSHSHSHSHDGSLLSLNLLNNEGSLVNNVNSLIDVKIGALSLELLGGLLNQCNYDEATQNVIRAVLVDVNIPPLVKLSILSHYVKNGHCLPKTPTTPMPPTTTPGPVVEPPAVPFRRCYRRYCGPGKPPQYFCYENCASGPGFLCNQIPQHQM